MHSQIYVSYLRQQYSSSFHCWQSYDKQLVEENHLASFLSVLDTVNIFLIPSHFLLSLIQKKPTAAGTSSTLLSRAGLLPTPQLRRTTTQLRLSYQKLVPLLVTSSLKNRDQRLSEPHYYSLASLLPWRPTSICTKELEPSNLWSYERLWQQRQELRTILLV